MRASVFGRDASPPLGFAHRICVSPRLERLLRELEWPPEQVAGIIFVTQSPDYALPGTSHVLRARLGLPD